MPRVERIEGKMLMRLMRSGLVYTAITAAGIIWYIVDRWEGSRAVAASLVLGGALALALSAAQSLSAGTRGSRFAWAPPLLVFTTVTSGAHALYARLAELEEPGSTLGGSGSDLIVLLLIPAWLLACGFTLASVMKNRSATDGAAR